VQRLVQHHIHHVVPEEMVVVSVETSVVMVEMVVVGIFVVKMVVAEMVVEMVIMVMAAVMVNKCFSPSILIKRARLYFFFNNYYLK
jgi:hypothetical protein